MNTVTVHEAQVYNMTSLQSAVQRMVGSIQQAQEGMLDAGRTLVWMFDNFKRSEVMDALREHAPSLNQSTIRKLEAFGRGTLDQRTLFSQSHAAMRLAYIPKAEQSSAFDEGVPYLSPSGEVVNLKPDSMSREQADQAIGVSGLRTIDEQRAWIAGRKEKVKTNGKAYVKDGKVYVSKSCTLTRYELAQLIAQMGE